MNNKLNNHFIPSGFFVLGVCLLQSFHPFGIEENAEGMK